jgi:hypothetical protein
MYLLLKPVGIVGIATAWGFGVPFVVIVTNSLNGNPAFILDSFQNFAVFPFLLVGTVIGLTWLVRRFNSRVALALALVIALAVGVVAGTYAIDRSPAIVRWTAGGVSASEAAALRTALGDTPPDAEVIASIGVMGRYCGRQYCYIAIPGSPRPVHAGAVVFLFVPNHDAFATPADSDAGIAYVRDVLHATPLVNSHGVTAFLWRPRPATRVVTVPRATDVTNP